LPEFTETFEIKCGASGIGVGGFLMQNGWLVAYFSEKPDDLIWIIKFMIRNSMN
jgi:hypothetical protein